ncbi:Coenzyme PQQ synthesis D [Candidatus Magnetomorum sp. HK-1]|nr:Coenzyme PQQ synthesis D [Candidatus Magnetomorum sp. HK-1]
MNTERLTSLAISDSGFIFDPSTGDAYNTNVIGVRIINLLKQGKDFNELMDLLIEQYEVTEEELEADLNDFIQILKNYHMV